MSSRYKVEVANDEGFAFLAARSPVYWSPWTKAIVNRLDSEIVAAIVFQDFNGHNLFMHVAADTSKRWITRQLIHNTFAYPFLQLGATRLTGWVESDNDAAIRFDEHLGFEREATLKGAGQQGQDVFIYTMHKDRCRWISKEDLCRYL